MCGSDDKSRDYNGEMGNIEWPTLIHELNEYEWIMELSIKNVIISF